MPPPTSEDWKPLPPCLPLEIWLLVIHHTESTHTLLALALCCSAFRDEAQRNLFYYPRVSESNAAQQYRFIDTIATYTQRLGQLVRIYEHKHGRERPDVPGGTHREVRAALRAMCNLKQLSFAKARTIPLRVLDGCRFKLDVFERGRPRREDPDILTHFLAIQPVLKHLALNGPLPIRRPPIPISGVCPRLEYLRAYQNEVGMFFRDGRRIKCLELEGETSGPKLTRCQSGQLEYLKVKTTSGEPQGYTLFTPAHLTSLVILELHVLGEDWRDKQIFEHLAFLADLPRLPALILSIPSQRDLIPCCGSVVILLFEQYPALERIDVKQPYLRRTVYTRFLPPRDGQKLKHHSVSFEDVYLGYKISVFD